MLFEVDDGFGVNTAADSSVVYDNLEVINRGRNPVKKQIERIVLSKIDCDCLAGYTLLFDFFRRLGELLNITTGNNKVASFARQGDGYGTANPAARPSYQTPLTF